jgi:adenylate cyclase class 2
MYEVELKLEAVHGPVRTALADREADELGAVRQIDTYYDAPHRDFATTDEALRLREERPRDGESARTEVTYKGPLVEAESKTREEAETAVDDPEAMAAVLEGLGFEPAATVRKTRERFAVDGFTVTLDAVDDLGEFVEVETAVEHESAVPGAREDAIEVLDSLGLDADDGIRTSYLGLLLAVEDGESDSSQ